MPATRCCTLGRLRRLFVQLALLIYALLVIFALFNKRSRVRYNSIPDVFLTSDIDGELEKIPVSKLLLNTQSYCYLNWDELEIQDVDVFNAPTIEEIAQRNPHVKVGGQWTPEVCSPFQNVAIIIPYRDRWTHLRILLNRLHPMLKIQQINYRIFVIEQNGTEEFNRGMLMNIGYTEAIRRGQFDCFIFHDVDLVPENDRNIYLCDYQTRQLSSAIDESRYHVLYYQYMGGVLAMTEETVVKINGYANVYWGWGQEDDDLSARATYSRLMLTRPPEMIGRYKMVRHKKFGQSDSGISLFMRWRERWKVDGLNSLKGKYVVLGEEAQALYTNITVDIGTAPTYDDILKLTPKDSSESILWYLQFYFP